MADQATDEMQVGSGDRATSSPLAADGASPHAGTTDVSPSPDASGNGLFGAQLEPVLLAQCGGRLSRVNWFRTDWQRGGALTGYATWSGDDGQDHAVVVKMPVPPREALWLGRLQSDDGEATRVVPRVYARGEALGGYDLAWVVMERLPHGPLGATWEGREFDLLIEAAGRFYEAADQFAPTGEAQQRDWRALFEQARRAVRDKALPEAQRWSKALKKAHRRLKKWIAVWEDRPVEGWCHGDLHLANALTREPPPHGPALLIDPAEVHAGHWVEDAVYLEHLYWGRDDRLAGRDLVKAIARARKEYGLGVESEWPRLADLRRVLLAGGAPAYLASEGGRVHLHAALDVLEAALDRLHA